MLSEMNDGVMTAGIYRWLESAVALCDASWIKPFAAHSLLPCKRWPSVGGVLEQSSCGRHRQQEGGGKKRKISLLEMFVSTLPLNLPSSFLMLLHSKYFQCRSAVSSRFASCVLAEAASGRPADLTQPSGCLIGPLDGRCRKSIFLLWSQNH